MVPGAKVLRRHNHVRVSHPISSHAGRAPPRAVQSLGAKPNARQNRVGRRQQPTPLDYLHPKTLAVRRCPLFPSRRPPFPTHHLLFFREGSATKRADQTRFVEAASCTTAKMSDAQASEAEKNVSFALALRTPPSPGPASFCPSPSAAPPAPYLEGINQDATDKPRAPSRSRYGR